MRVIPSLLWIDSIGGLSAGAFALTFAGWLSRFYQLPMVLVVTMGIANLAYGSYSFALARRRTRPRALVTLLVVANASWAVFCALTAVVVASSASLFGLAHLSAECIFVGGLAWLEWRNRESLLVAVHASPT